MVTKYRINSYEMHCEGKLKLRSHNTSYCFIIEVVTKAVLLHMCLLMSFYDIDLKICLIISDVRDDNPEIEIVRLQMS